VVCPEKPEIVAPVVEGNVILPLNDALRLRQWIVDTEICHLRNQVELEGYAEKLENRLKAVGGVQ
jgi:hypothetical protein